MFRPRLTVAFRAGSFQRTAGCRAAGRRATAHTAAYRSGFTLVELLVVIAVIGLLIGLLLPAVQASREASRRIKCENNIKNQVLALHLFHDVHREFPAGCDSIKGLEQSWAYRVLPQLEQGPLYQQIDGSKRWDDAGGNLATTSATLAVFRCPTSFEVMPGDTDYSGISGSGLSGLGWSQAFNCGVLIRTSAAAPRPVRLADVTDGASNTIAIAESVDRELVDHGRWADGLNIITHDNGGINIEKGEIYSLHPGGAFVGRADGSVSYLSELIELYVLGAICTRNGGELTSGTDF